MFVYVINKNGEPLMPCKPAKAKHLLREGKAKVKQTRPFTIKLLWDCENLCQPVTAGMDTGSKIIGSAATTNGQVVYQAEIQVRQDVSKKIKQRAMYRRNRRGRKCRYRPARWLNRANSYKDDRLAPSIRSKVNSHLSKGTGFIKGKRSSGFFALMDILNNTVTALVSVKKNCTRLTARTTTLIGEWQLLPETKDFGVFLPQNL